ncbi:MAG: hypothetical protein ACI909_003851, partial [Planctomycetota bacterium]
MVFGLMHYKKTRIMTMKHLTNLILMTFLSLGIYAQTAEECLTFDGFAAGDIVDVAYSNGGYGPISFTADNPHFPGLNAAMIFDSANPTGEDDDLGTPNQLFGGPGIGIGGEGGAYVNNVARGNVLIVSEDLDASDPDDVDKFGVILTVDFTAIGPVTVNRFTLIDNDGGGDGSEVELFDSIMNLLAVVPFSETGDNGVSVVDIIGGVNGVAYMVFTLNGSGAIDDICFVPEDPSCDCVCKAPINLISTVNGRHTVDLDWDYGDECTAAFEIVGHSLGSCHVSGFTLTSLSKRVGHLDPGTSYAWSARTLCSNGTYSNFAEPDTFTTDPVPSPRLAEELPVSPIGLMPNPANNFIHIELGEVSNHVVSIIDMSGKTVMNTIIFGSTSA